MFQRMILGLILGGCCLVAMAAAPTIPALPWTPRSDWVNVKTAVTPGAVGDGVADDTAALQKVFDMIKDGITIYLPAGTYRITKTLVLKPGLRVSGLTLIGHGRDTRLVWDGAVGGEMLLDSGATNSRYVGLLFDGRGKAAVGFHHANGVGHFETEVRHQHLALMNFTDAGMLVDSEVATAETITENCLFENCKRGIAFVRFNDYNYIIDGCEFRRCDTGVQCLHGNTYVRNCHFEGSTGVDISLAPEHHSSVRRCTSVGSKMFIAYGNPVAPLVIQDCRVAGWTNPEGAITLSGAPVTLFDCVFTNPPGAVAPVKILRDGQRLFVSQNVSKATGDVIQPGHKGVVFEIPAGKRTGTRLSAEQRFLQETVAIPTVVFDAKRDFGAKGDNRANDTAAVQQTIDAARARGKGAIAYLPVGIYRITSTLHVTGADYTVGGSGFKTGLRWDGPEGGTMIEVQDPQRVTLENMDVGSHDVTNDMKNGIDILQTSSGAGKPSSVTYDNISVYGRFDKQPFRKGLWLRGLDEKAVVRVSYMEGNLHLVDAARATVLVQNHIDGSTVVEGKDVRRNGFFGMLTSLTTISTHALYVFDNQSMTAGDFYVEQADNGFVFTGSADLPPGRITLQCLKLQMWSPDPAITHTAFDIRDYRGQISVGSMQYYIDPKVMTLLHKGKNPLEMLLWSSFFYNTKLEVQKEDGAQIYQIGNGGVDLKLDETTVEERRVPETLAKLSVALDDMRALGALDLRLDHPEVK
ncbi:MAG: glycosyl hydrolase family 28-related protein [Armatimonadota bacterium]